MLSRYTSSTIVKLFLSGKKPCKVPTSPFSFGHRLYCSELSEREAGSEEAMDADYQEMCQAASLPSTSHSSANQSVLLLLPKVKWGRQKLDKIASELKLQEAQALIESLPGWRVTEKLIVPLPSSQYSINREEIFGSGKLLELRAHVLQAKANKAITCVMIDVDVLSGAQHESLYSFWKIPIYDRYNVVLQIFKTHAKTQEARLQIAMAEIPYLKTRIKELHSTDLSSEDSSFAEQLDTIGGSAIKTYWQKRRELLRYREQYLRGKLKELRDRRKLMRDQRSDRGLSKTPEVAVLGYTNSGKTSLIKVLTEDKRLLPLNRLFATLESTQHRGTLPNNVPVVYSDTVGFISDLPTELVASFEATLDSIRNADLLIHVRDISHPDTVAQKRNVLKTLEMMKLPPNLTDNMIELCNKADLLSPNRNLDELDCDKDAILSSCETMLGIGDLNALLELELMEASGRFKRTFKVPNGGSQYDFLTAETTVLDSIPSEDGNHLFVTTMITEPALRKFQSMFGQFSRRIKS